MRGGMQGRGFSKRGGKKWNRGSRARLAPANSSKDRGPTGGVMRLVDKVLVSLTLTVSLASSAFGATITGNVQGPDGKPFMGAFVVAENSQNKMTVSVLSNAQGRYHIGNLPAATYK